MSDLSPDDAGDVREEDAFDVSAVAGWLREHAPAGDVPDGVPRVRQFTGGASNLTYLLRYPDRDLVLRRPPAGQKAKGAHDVRREFTLQQRLRPVYTAVPRMIALCEDPSVAGSDFYVMERVEGTVLRRDLPAGMELTAAQARALCTDVLDKLVELHSLDPVATGLGDLGRGEGYVARQVGGWSTRFRRAHTEDIGDFEEVITWLEANQPADVARCVIHNDFRLDNVVLDEDRRVVGVLDWELATVGDPLMDLGSALAYWVEADDDAVFAQFRQQPTHLPGMLTRAEVVDYYATRTGLAVTPEQWTFYEVFGLFRVAVIAQQIYFRYRHGQTTNEAFAIFGDAVRYLEARCQGMLR